MKTPFYSLFHYRDRQKREIDFLIKDNRGNIVGVEVKAGSAVTLDSFKHLIWFKDNIFANQSFIGIVLYTGTNLVSFAPGM